MAAAFVVAPTYRGTFASSPPAGHRGRCRRRVLVVSASPAPPPVVSGSSVDEPPLVAARDPAKPQPAPPRQWNLIPLATELYDLWKYGAALTMERNKTYGPFWLGTFTGKQCMVVADRALVNAVLSEPDLFPSTFPFPSLRKVFGDGTVGTLEGDAHSATRRKLNPAFSPDLFPTYCAPTLTKAEAFWADIAQLEMDRANPIRMDGRFAKFVFDGAVGMVSGIEDNLDETFKHFSSMTNGIFAPEIPLPFGPAHESAKSREKIGAILKENVDKRLTSHAEIIARLRSFEDNRMGIEARKDAEAGKVDLFTLILAQSGLSVAGEPENDPEEYERLMSEVVRDMVFFWFAGYETTSSALSSALFELGRHPDVVERIRAEADSIAARSGSISVQNLISDMPVLDGFVNEVLRLHPPAIGVFRRVGPNGASVMGRDVEANLPVIVDLSVPNRSPDIFPNPDRLDVDRYSADAIGKDRAKQARAGLIAFGVGHHRCIAAALAPINIKSVLTVLLHQYEFEVDQNVTSKFAVLPSHRPVAGAPLVSLRRRA